MQAVGGILILVSGAIFPLAMMFWLNTRLSRKPTLRPGQVGLILAFNGVLPLAMVTLGLGLMSDRFWSLSWLRTVMAAAWLAVAVILVALAVAGVAARREDGHGG